MRLVAPSVFGDTVVKAEIELWQVADDLIAQHGPAAEQEAISRANERSRRLEAKTDEAPLRGGTRRGRRRSRTTPGRTETTTVDRHSGEHRACFVGMEHSASIGACSRAMSRRGGGTLESPR